MPAAREKAFRLSVKQHKVSQHLRSKKKDFFNHLTALGKPFGVRLYHRLGNRHTDMPQAGAVRGLHTCKETSSEVRKKNSIRIEIKTETGATSPKKTKEQTIKEGIGAKSGNNPSSKSDCPASKSFPPTYLEQSIGRQLQDQRKHLVYTLMSSVLGCLLKKLDTIEEPCDGDSSNGKSSHGSSGVRWSQQNKQPIAGYKRQLREDDSDGLEDDDEGDNDRRDKNNKRAKRTTEPVIFACPYYKFNPDRFRTCRTCSVPSFKEIHRLKEHVMRKHRLREQCNRCCEFFQNEEVLRKHQRSSKACPIVSAKRNYADGFDKDQAKKLSGRPRMTPEDRWRHMYCTLFNIEPGSPHIPSPYHKSSCSDSTHSESRAKEFSKPLTNIVREKLPEMVYKVVVSEVLKATSTVGKEILPKVTEGVQSALQNLMHVHKSIQLPPGLSSNDCDEGFSSHEQLDENLLLNELLSDLSPTFEPQDAFDFGSINDGSLYDFSSSSLSEFWPMNTSVSSIDDIQAYEKKSPVHQQTSSLPRHRSSPSTELYSDYI